MKILLAMEQHDVKFDLQALLRANGFKFDLVLDDSLDDKIATGSYDLAVMDYELPNRSGLEVLGTWRKHHPTTPVVMVIRADQVQGKLDSLKAGATDYIEKPCSGDDFLHRISLALQEKHNTNSTLVSLNGINLDPERHWVSNRQQQLFRLTPTESRLLAALMRAPGETLSRDYLYQQIRDSEKEVSSNMVEVYINKLRVKIGFTSIRTRRGAGYYFYVPR